MTDADRRSLVTLPASFRPPMAGAGAAAPIDEAERVEFTLVLRRRAPLPADVIRAGDLTPATLERDYGADPRDAESVTTSLRASGMQVLWVHGGSRRVRAATTVAGLRDAFGTELTGATVPGPGGRPVPIRVRQGELHVPAAIADRVIAVLGLDSRPQARTRTAIATAEAVQTSYTPVQLAGIYSFPEADGAAQQVAIVELGGGFAPSDLDTYFGGLGLTTPTVRSVGVDGATNVPGQDPNGADAEVLLDVEVAGAVAPAAEIVVYFAPNTDAGFVDAISTAAHASPTPAALSISWGQSEDDWTAQARAAMDAALADAAALGVTVTVAAGDAGSSDSAAGVHTDFPASSPHVLGCGGTTLDADPASGQVRSETVWNNGVGQGATGGGVSDVFSRPDWQATVGVPARSGGGTGRGVPDVAAVADPSTGYQVYVDGRALVIGGTSAVAPLWAGLTARFAQLLGRRLGLLPPTLCAGVTAGAVAPGFRDITQGTNGAYRAAPGWDPCTGLGVPVGTALLDRLRTGL